MVGGLRGVREWRRDGDLGGGMGRERGREEEEGKKREGGREWME